MSLDKLFTLAVKIIRIISLENVAIWSFASLVGIVGYTAYENRVALTDRFLNSANTDVPGTETVAAWKISPTSAAKLKQLVDSNDIIAATIIVNADIRSNRRLPIHWYSAQPTIQKTLDSLFTGRYGGIPLFTSDEKNNENIVSVINGEFACSTFLESGNTAVFPGMASQFPFICRTSLPPYYGQFSGYITITLSRVPSSSELDKIKADTLNISTEIFFRDILPTTKSAKT